jgi:uncharacterized protein YdeI (YjbR/CyaY-like superfamily)
MDIVYFETPAEFRAWLEANHDKAQELWVGYYKKSSGQVSITWPESVDQALCFGWIDGIRKSVDDTRYTNRFTPRKTGSNWSAVNIRRVEELIRQGLMHPVGLRAFEARDQEKSSRYSYERENARLDDAYEQQFRANSKAWEFFQMQAPSYQKAAIWWVVSARQDATRAKRLAKLIEDSEQGRTVPPLTRPGQGKRG